MRTSIVILAALLASSAVRASDSWEMKASATAVSNYMYDGISQSWNRPAAQADFEVEHDSGAYAGVFVSTISPRQYPGGNVEAEAWVGYGWEFSRQTSLGVELAYIAFPGSNLSYGQCGAGLPCAAQSFNTGLARVVGQWDWLSMQLDYALSDYYGASAASGFAGSTRGSTRYELGAEHELPWDARWTGLVRLGYTHYSSAFLLPVMPGVDGSGAFYSLALRRRFELDSTRIDLQFGVAGTSSGITSRSLTDGAQTRLGGPMPYVGITLRL
ncbi:MAG TPA: TorF family putative porin [Burkholderiaceae bacterium]|nr:TorF family putative porin [Burkholderiaceae bacterium]